MTVKSTAGTVSGCVASVASGIASVAEFKQVKSGTVLHDGSPDCLGLLLVKSGQLRA